MIPPVDFLYRSHGTLYRVRQFGGGRIWLMRWTADHWQTLREIPASGLAELQVGALPQGEVLAYEGAVPFLWRKEHP
jgi:hypothetical protein